MYLDPGLLAGFLLCKRWSEPPDAGVQSLQTCNHAPQQHVCRLVSLLYLQCLLSLVQKLLNGTLVLLVNASCILFYNSVLHTAGANGPELCNGRSQYCFQEWQHNRLVNNAC